MKKELTMYPTETINIIIALCGAACPITYLYFVNRCVKSDLEHTDEIGEQPGQTHHTAIIDETAADGHAEFACGHPVIHPFAPAH